MNIPGIGTCMVLAALLLGVMPSAGAAGARKTETGEGAMPPGSAAAPPSRKEEPGGADAVIHKMDFRQARVVDVIRALAEVSGLNIVATEEAAKREVTVFLQKISVRDALDTISKNAGLWYRQEKNGTTYRIMTTDEFQKDMVIYREDTLRVFNLLHPNPVVVATAIRDLYGRRVIFSPGVVGEDYGMRASAIANRGRAGGGVGGGMGGMGMAGMGGMGGMGMAGMGMAGMGAAGMGAIGSPAGTPRESDKAVNEKLTADQLARLQGALQGGDGSQISGEAAQEVSRREQPIYVTANREHNLIIVRTSDSTAIKEIERLIKEMDRPTPQVLLEMKILDLTIGDSFSQLFNLETVSSDLKQGLSLGNAAIPKEAGSLIYTFFDRRLATRLELLEKNNKINTLSSPVLLASNNRPARVFVGEERVLVTGVTATDPVLNASGGVVTPAKITYQTEVRDIGTTLNLLPKINADGTVTLVIQQDVSSVLEGAVTLPPITVGNSTQNFKIDSVKTANIEGIVVAKDGITVAIGGLISSTTSRDERKVPFVSDIPVVGELFKSKQTSTRKSEMILLITPRIITNPGDGENVSRDQLEPLTTQEW